MSTCILDNAAEQAGERFASLESCFDPGAIRQLEEIGVAPGWSCLEVGGGGGSIARWLADRVGPGGEVVVTDIVEAHLRIWTGGSPDSRLHHANIEQVRDRLTSAGLITHEEMERFLALTANPQFSCNFHPLVSARGRRAPR